MNHSEHPTDAAVRRLPLDSDEHVRLLSDPEAKQALFQEITTMPIEITDPPAHSTRAPLTRRSLVLVATLASLGLATVAGAIAYLTVDSSTSVGCHTPDGAVAVVDAVTGDPVADCGRVWTELAGGPPPTLIAYDNTKGGIEVVPADTEVPDGWRELDSGNIQDSRVIELKAALADHIDGLNSDCFETDAARALATAELDRLALGDWIVDVERGEADGTDTCSDHHLDRSRQRVVITPAPRDWIISTDETPHTVLADELRQTLSTECLTVTEAADAARRLATAAELDDPNLEIHEMVDDSADCARADMNIGGSTAITLHGPTR